MSIVDVALGIHVSAGIVALATMLVPIVAAKGGTLHRRVGWWFVVAMAVITATALPVSALRAASAASAGAAHFSKGALFITLFSGAAVWKGIRVLRFKAGERHTHPLDLGISIVVLAAAAWAFSLGVTSGNLILLFFGPFAALSALLDLRYWLNPRKPRMHWFFEHMGGMMGSSVAAITAFGFFGARSMGFGTPGVVMFLLPTLILLPVSFLLRRHYRRKFGLA